MPGPDARRYAMRLSDRARTADVPGSRTIKVGFAVHRSAASGRRPGPVVYTSGGPGSGSIQLTGYLSEMIPGRDRDVVVIEQRGSRWPEPALECPEIARGVLDALAGPGPMRAETAGIARGANACRERLARQGVDLRGYTTAEIAAEVADLRRALGYPKWNLFGVSYSTRSMLAAAAADPDGVRSVVLDSFLPAEVDWYGDAQANLDATLRRRAGAGRRRLTQLWRGVTALRGSDRRPGGRGRRGSG
ncbi:alpha/beta fold hydrolase, partial [Spongiactinospora gelatinilytica]